MNSETFNGILGIMSSLVESIPDGIISLLFIPLAFSCIYFLFRLFKKLGD